MGATLFLISLKIASLIILYISKIMKYFVLSTVHVYKPEKKVGNNCCHNGREYGALNHHRVHRKFQNAISLNNQAGSQIDRGE